MRLKPHFALQKTAWEEETGLQRRHERNRHRSASVPKHLQTGCGGCHGEPGEDEGCGHRSGVQVCSVSPAKRIDGKLLVRWGWSSVCLGEGPRVLLLLKTKMLRRETHRHHHRRRSSRSLPSSSVTMVTVLHRDQTSPDTIRKNQ